jgi:hypothetical protein
MTLRCFAQEVEVANDRAVCERPWEFRNQCKDSHQYKPWYCAAGILALFSAAARSTI